LALECIIVGSCFKNHYCKVSSIVEYHNGVESWLTLLIGAWAIAVAALFD
jgi:hypothetical protein